MVKIQGWGGVGWGAADGGVSICISVAFWVRCSGVGRALFHCKHLFPYGWFYCNTSFKITALWLADFIDRYDSCFFWKILCRSVHCGTLYWSLKEFIGENLSVFFFMKFQWIQSHFITLIFLGIVVLLYFPFIVIWNTQLFPHWRMREIEEEKQTT